MTFEYEKPFCKKGKLMKTRCECKYKKTSVGNNASAVMP